MALNLGPLNVLLRLQGADKFRRDTKQAASGLDLIAKASVAATAALAATGYQALQATRTFAEFEKGMTRVGAVTNSLGTTAFAGLTERAQQLASTTEFTARQVADAMGFMGMAGMSTNQIFDATPAVLQLASAGMVDVATAADTVTNIMAGYGLEAKDLKETNDILVATFTNSNTSLQGLGETFKYAGSVAKIAGLSLKQTAAMIGLMGNAGHQASVAGTALRSTLLRLQGNLPKVRRVVEKYGLEIKDSSGKMKDFAEIFRQLGPVVKNASDAQDLFGTYAVAAMSAAVEQGTGKLDEMIGKIEKAGNVAERVSSAQLQTLDGRIKIMQSNFEGLQISIGEALGPATVKIVDNLSSVFGDLRDAVDGVGVGLLDSEAWASGLATLKNLVLAVASAIDTIAQFAIKAVMFPITLLTRAIAEAEWFIGTMMKAFKNIPGMGGVYQAGVGMREEGISRRENLQQLMSGISSTKPLEDTLRSFFTMFESTAKSLIKSGGGGDGGGGGGGGGGDGDITFSDPTILLSGAAGVDAVRALFEGIRDKPIMGLTEMSNKEFDAFMESFKPEVIIDHGKATKEQAMAARRAATEQNRLAKQARATGRDIEKLVGGMISGIRGDSLGATFGGGIGGAIGGAIGGPVGTSIGSIVGQTFAPFLDVLTKATNVFKPLIDVVNEMGVGLFAPLVVAFGPTIERLAVIARVVLLPAFEFLGNTIGSVQWLFEEMWTAGRNFQIWLENLTRGDNDKIPYIAGKSFDQYMQQVEEARRAAFEALNEETHNAADNFRELNEELTNVPIGVKRLRSMQYTATRGVPFPGMFNQPAF